MVEREPLLFFVKDREERGNRGGRRERAGRREREVCGHQGGSRRVDAGGAAIKKAPAGRGLAYLFALRRAGLCLWGLHGLDVSFACRGRCGPGVRRG